MAIGAQMCWEVRTTGSNTACSGGFNPTNGIMINDGAATSANTASPVFTSASYTFVAGDVGAKLFIRSGTNWIPGWYDIVSVSAGAATLNATAGQATLYAGTNTSTNTAASFIPSTAIGCATTASPTTATWSVDYSQQNTARFAFTDLVSVTSTTITSAANPFGKNCVGNTIYITSGTSWTVQFVEITQVTGVTATVEKTVGGAGLTGGNGYLGGALAGPQLALAIASNGNKLWVKSGTYSVTSTTANVVGGRLNLTNTNTMQGYASQRMDMGSPPVFQASGITNNTLISLNNNSYSQVINIKADGASLTNIRGFALVTARQYASACVAVNCTNGGFSDGKLYRCSTESCSIGYTYTATQSANLMYCVAKSSTTVGFQVIQSELIGCIASLCAKGFENTGAGSSDGNVYINCTAYDSTTLGFASVNGNCTFIKCLATSGTYGFSINSGNSGARLIDCAGYNNSTADVLYSAASTSFGIYNYNFISLSADPFTNAAGGDFSLNSTAGGGALLKSIANAFPTVITTTTYNDVGAAQTQGSSGGGGGGSYPFC